MPVVAVTTLAAECVEGFGIAMYKSLGLSVNDRDKYAGSYRNSSHRQVTTDRSAGFYMNLASHFIVTYKMYWQEKKNTAMIKFARLV